MKLLIKNVEPGTVYEGNTDDYWIIGELKNGQEIKVFDFVPYDLRNHLNEQVDCLIIASFIELVNEDFNQEGKTIKGKFKNRFILPHDKEGYAQSWHFDLFLKKERYALQTENGFFIIDPDDLGNLSFNEEDNISLKVGRFDLITWHQGELIKKKV